MGLVFEVIKGGGDNFAYVLGCSRARKAAVVDPVNAHRILELCRERRLEITHVLNTHGHPDHTEGNGVIVDAAGAVMFAHPEERIPGTKPLADGDCLEVGEIKIEVLHSPGHTRGSLMFKVNNKLISGDTLFLAGAGNTRFGGDVKDLFLTFETRISALPGRLEVWPGHDYAENNLRFAQTIEPENKAIDKKLKELKEVRKNRGLPRSTLSQEKKYNPFLRYRKPELVASLKSEIPDLPEHDPFTIFKTIRELRNEW